MAQPGIPTLRRQLPFGTIHPPHNGASIEQFGCYYTHDGEFVGFVDEGGQEKFDAATLAERRANRNANLSPSDPARAIAAPSMGDEDGEAQDRELERRERAAAIEERELAIAERKAALAAGQPSPTDKPKADGKPKAADKPKAEKPEGDAGDASDVDLAAWARGEKTYPFFAIKKAVQDKHPAIILTNTKTIVAGLVAQGVVAEDDVKR